MQCTRTTYIVNKRGRSGSIFTCLLPSEIHSFFRLPWIKMIAQYRDNNVEQKKSVKISPYKIYVYAHRKFMDQLP
jgi:hypothetical protein